MYRRGLLRSREGIDRTRHLRPVLMRRQTLMLVATRHGIGHADVFESSLDKDICFSDRRHGDSLGPAIALPFCKSDRLVRLYVWTKTRTIGVRPFLHVLQVSIHPGLVDEKTGCGQTIEAHKSSTKWELFI